MGVPIGALIAITAAKKRKQLEIQKQLNLINQKENPSMECYNHKDKKVVGMCGRCYKAICHDCTSPGCDLLVCRNCDEITKKGNNLKIILFLFGGIFGLLFTAIMFWLKRQ